MIIIMLMLLYNHTVNFITVVTGLMLLHAHCRKHFAHCEVDLYT